MLRLVLDTNILISATIERAGAPSKILEAWRRGEVLLITSPVLIAELQEVLTRPRIQRYQWMTRDEIVKLVTLLGSAAIQTSGACLVVAIQEDPADDFVLSAALEGLADYIVTGNVHLLKLKEYRGIRIVTPKEFSAKYL